MTTLTLAAAEYVAAQLDYRAAKARKEGAAGVVLPFALAADILEALRPGTSADWASPTATMLPGGGS